ncbi:hypothetical protein E4U55_006153 [Claviceps digitariae]|nr:hypothetical protein E4U55_006153 [Claviceps digitariae]
MYSDEHESDDDTRSSNGTDSADDGSEESACYGRGLIDDEAEESGEESDEESDEESSYESETLDADSATDFEFPQFMQLPPELRLRIWHLHCPDLSARARVLQFTLSPSSAIMGKPDHYSVKDHLSLSDQTQSLRAMLSTHRESRSIALRKYPDELSMDAGSGNAIVRCRKETDVISLKDLTPHKEHFLPEFAENVQILAIEPLATLHQWWITLTHTAEDTISLIKSIFPNLKRVLIYVQTINLQTTYPQRMNLRWCAAEYVHAYMVETCEKSPGVGEDTQSLFCWPDVDRYRDFADRAVPRLCPPDLEEKWGVEFRPIAEFEMREGLERYDRLRQSKLIPCLGDRYNYGDSEDSDEGSGSGSGSGDGNVDVVDSDDDTQDGTNLDEYESEGIDDGEIIELESSSEDELLTGDSGRFSSPELDDAEDMDEADAEPSQMSRKRKAIVLDSDDEEEEEEEGEGDDNDEDEPRRKRARQSRSVLDSDDEDEPQRKRARQSRLVLDSDDEEDRENALQGDQSEVEVVLTRRVPKSARVMLISSDEDEEDIQGGAGTPESDSQEEDEEDEDEDVIPTKFSLAERLERARNDIPISSASEEDSEQPDEDSGGEEEDEDDEDEDEDGLLDAMAGEETEDDDEEEVEYAW